MKQRYNEVMEHIVVTDEMRARILAAVQQADLTPRKKAIRFDRILKMAAAAAPVCLRELPPELLRP